MKARAFWAVEPGRGIIRDSDITAPTGDEVLIRTLWSGVSRGTESLVWRGGVPGSQHQAMRCPFQDGDFPFPVKYGYASVGVIEDGPAERVGETVFVLYPHQDRYVVPTGWAHPLPEGVPPRRAVLAANLETAVNALWDSGATALDRVVVFGAGVVGGLFAVLAARLPGAEVTLVDLDPGKRTLAEALGIAFATPAEAPGGADLVVNASAAPDALAMALTRAGQDATVLELSWYGDRPATLPLGEAFHARRLRLVSSQVGRVPPARAPRWTQARRLSQTLPLLRDPIFDLFLGETIPFHQLPDAMARLSSGAGAVCATIAYDPTA